MQRITNRSQPPFILNVYLQSNQKHSHISSCNKLSTYDYALKNQLHRPQKQNDCFYSTNIERNRTCLFKFRYVNNMISMNDQQPLYTKLGPDWPMLMRRSRRTQQRLTDGKKSMQGRLGLQFHGWRSSSTASRPVPGPRQSASVNGQLNIFSCASHTTHTHILHHPLILQSHIH